MRFINRDERTILLNCIMQYFIKVIKINCSNTPGSGSVLNLLIVIRLSLITEKNISKSYGEKQYKGKSENRYI